MEYIFFEYPKCSTCQKAKKFLEENNFTFTTRNIIDTPPTFTEMNLWMTYSKKELKQYFNTSGIKYRELHIKEKILKLNNKEIIELLISDGMLIKRPLLIGNQFLINGFKQSAWSQLEK